MKRFSDTARFDEGWYVELPVEMKSAWELIWAKCDCAGVWEPSFKLADFQIGKRVNWEEFHQKLESRIFILPSGAWWIRDFVKMQCGTLSVECRAHLPVISRLRSHGLMTMDSLSIVYPKTIHSHKEQEQEEEQEQEKGKGRESQERENGQAFEEFWQAYPRRVGKAHAEAAWKKHGCESLLPQILVSVRACKISADWTKEGGQFIPHPATWLNRRGWEDELAPAKNGTGIRENIQPLIINFDDEP